MTMETALALPDEQQFRRDIQAINQFQAIVRSQMKSGHDYGVIPGTQKPTLLKPGAEKIAKLLGLADVYEIMDRQEDWERGFFRYLIKCRLVTVSSGVTVSEGLGECNSMESRYRWRWLFQSQLPAHLKGDTGKEARSKMVIKEIHTKNGPTKQYRLENEDIYSQVNTILKISKKRALVDAALSAGRLSEVFTQDIEDLAENGHVVSDSQVPSTSTPEKQPTPAESSPTAYQQVKEFQGWAHEQGLEDVAVLNVLAGVLGKPVERMADWLKEKTLDQARAAIALFVKEESPQNDDVPF